MRKISITNLAWTKENDESAYQLMKDCGFSFLEVAPSKIWDQPSNITAVETSEFLNMLSRYKIAPVALQGILYGRPDLTIFEDANTRRKTLEYLKKMIDLAIALKVQAIVFGSPKNKERGILSKSNAMNIAVDFFGSLGEYALSRGVAFCIEATPEIYGADFILTTKDAIELVQACNSQGLRLNLDLGALKSEGDELFYNLEKALPFTGHFHVSEPGLETVDLDERFHGQVVSQIKASGYKGAVSIEMLSQDKFNPPNLEKVLRFIKRTYGNF